MVNPVRGGAKIMEGTASSGQLEGFAFAVGELVRHRNQSFRGVIVDAHPHFQGPVDEGWVGQAMRQRWQQPWYELLVHGTEHVVYLPQESVELDPTLQPIDHPLLRLFFNHFDEGRYTLEGQAH
jgi:heat shock protein HspQ